MRLQKDERILHELKPEPQVLAIWFFTKCIPALFIELILLNFIFMPIITMKAYGGPPSQRIALMKIGLYMSLIAGILLLIGNVIYCVYLRRTYAYFITTKRCIFHGGILRRVERSVPYHKITDVEQSQTIIERGLSIASLRIFTPGTASVRPTPFKGQEAELNFVGLRDTELPSETINEVLRRFEATGE